MVDDQWHRLSVRSRCIYREAMESRKLSDTIELRARMDMEDVETIFWSLLCCARPRMETENSLDEKKLGEGMIRVPERGPNHEESIWNEKTQTRKEVRWKVTWCLRVWNKLKNKIRKQMKRFRRRGDSEPEFEIVVGEAAGKLHFD